MLKALFTKMKTVITMRESLKINICDLNANNR
jgi:hypothetical protein